LGKRRAKLKPTQEEFVRLRRDGVESANVSPPIRNAGKSDIEAKTQLLLEFGDLLAAAARFKPRTCGGREMDRLSNLGVQTAANGV
jgi:hypothetical protein